MVDPVEFSPDHPDRLAQEYGSRFEISSVGSAGRIQGGESGRHGFAGGLGQTGRVDQHAEDLEVVGMGELMQMESIFHRDVTTRGIGHAVDRELGHLQGDDRVGPVREKLRVGESLEP